MWYAWWCTSLLALALLQPASLAAQSVSPPIVEVPAGAKLSGTIVLANESIFPLVATLDVRGFEVDSLGQLRDVPIDTTRLRVKLSQLSARLVARQSLTIFYDIQRLDGGEGPLWLQIMSAFTGARAANGLALRIELPHVVYAYQKAPLLREDVHVAAFGLDRRAGKAVLVLENTSDKLARAQEIEVSAPGAPTKRMPAFPFFPKSRRVVTVDWDHPAPPTVAKVKFGSLSFDAVPVGVPVAPGAPQPMLASDTTSTPPTTSGP